MNTWTGRFGHDVCTGGQFMVIAQAPPCNDAKLQCSGSPQHPKPHGSKYMNNTCSTKIGPTLAFLDPAGNEVLEIQNTLSFKVCNSPTSPRICGDWAGGCPGFQPRQLALRAFGTPALALLPSLKPGPRTQVLGATGDSKKLEYGPRTISAGLPASLRFEVDDSHTTPFWLLLHVVPEKLCSIARTL